MGKMLFSFNSFGKFHGKKLGAITLYLGSIEIDLVISKLCYKEKFKKGIIGK